MATIDEVLSILLESKKIEDLPTATAFSSSDWFIFYNVNTQQTEKISGAALTGQGGWLWIEGSNVQKASGNTSKTVLEINDIVWFKDIVNAGDPLTLVGFTYLGGDKTLLDSYEQTKSITT